MSYVTGFSEQPYLDFDSFSASVEQHFNQALRGKPIIVVAPD